MSLPYPYKSPLVPDGTPKDKLSGPPASMGVLYLLSPSAKRWYSNEVAKAGEVL